MKIIECPRDAMQGMKDIIPSEIKANYINALLKVGFDTIDFGSFVSPKAVPQMADSAEVLSMLDMRNTKSKLLAIIANERGAKEAAQYAEITYLGFPLSISETFQKRNTNKTIAEAFEALADIQNICLANNKVLVVYISMGFGNPYGDPYNVQLVADFIQKLDKLNVPIISLADTIGASTTQNIIYLFQNLISSYPHIEFGAHLHSVPDTAVKKIEAAYFAGCRRFDAAMKGFGGCPMAEDKLTGNIATEKLISFLKNKQVHLGLDYDSLEEAYALAGNIFN